MADIEGFGRYLREQELAPNTVRVYLQAVRLFAQVSDKFDKSAVIRYKNFLIGRCKPATVNLYLVGIRKYAAFVGSPVTVKAVKEPKKTHIENIITPEQYTRLTEGLKAGGRMRELAHILLLSETGMRISEALRITKRDILAGEVTMYTKAHMRTIILPKKLADEIKPYLDELEDDDIVMRSRLDRPISASAVREEFRRFSKQFDIPKEVMHAHTFRHFFAMEFVRKCENIALLADILGHGEMNITRIYLRQSKEQQRKIIDDIIDW